MIITMRKKAQEVSFVLLKIAGYIRHKELASRIESISYQLIESLYSDDLNTAMSKVEAAIGLASLASNIGEMNPNNTTIVLRELENLKNGIVQYREAKEVREMPSFEGLFSKLTIAQPTRARQAVAPSLIKQQVVNTERPKAANPLASVVDNGNAAIIRQDLILAKIISANGNKLQLKDLISAFPDISERTLRYDLVKLCQIGKLKREGSGGPSNFYVAANLPVSRPSLPHKAPDSLVTPTEGVMNNPHLSL